MLKTNRTRLSCSKPIRADLSILDRFTVVVLNEDVSAAKSKYEHMGYDVTRVTL